MVAWYWLFAAVYAGWLACAILAASAYSNTNIRNAQDAADRDAWKAEADRWRRVAETQWDVIDGYERRHQETAQLREQTSGENAEMAVVA